MSDAFNTVRGDTPDISQLTPATGRVGQPATGTYGEQQALADLERALPAPTATPEQEGPSFEATGGEMPLPPPSGDLPRSILAPSTRPDEPLATPPAQPVPIGETPSEQQIQWLQALVRDPNLRETTRMWAQSILDGLEIS